MLTLLYFLTVFILLLPILYLPYYLNFQFDLHALHGHWQTSMLIISCRKANCCDVLLHPVFTAYLLFTVLSIIACMFVLATPKGLHSQKLH